MFLFQQLRAAPKKSSIFGAAKPVDTSAREKEIEAKWASKRESLHSEKSPAKTSGGGHHNSSNKDKRKSSSSSSIKEQKHHHHHHHHHSSYHDRDSVPPSGRLSTTSSHHADEVFESKCVCVWKCKNMKAVDL